ncbi:MAG: alpha-L-fucosidase [Tannerella sp.]|jgi:alpha-L-fucosidase|nr:alpha-L-fucosidase [Tannerella sp.]
MTEQNQSRRHFLKRGTALAAASIIAPQYFLGKTGSAHLAASGLHEDVFQQFKCPQWFKDVKFGLWLHWGPQSIPAKGAGWYARHMYMPPELLGQGEAWGQTAWPYHRLTYGHQSEFGYKDLCNLWKAEKFNAEETVRQFKKWGARYVAIMANHHDNFDLFNSSVHKWNTVNVGPKRDLLGEFAEAARNSQLKWVATAHTYRAKGWFSFAFGSDVSGLRKGVPYDGNLTLEDGKGKWWEGLDPQQLYAHKYDAFESELRQRHLDLVNNYRPDMLYFDDNQIPPPMRDACIKLYENSLKQNGSIQSIVTVKEAQRGTILDFEMGIAEGMPAEYWQTDTSFNKDWFLKTEENTELHHNARSLKELLVDIASKRGSLLLNVAVYPDGSVPDDQHAVLEEFGEWLAANGEAIYATEPWKVYGEGGISAGGKFKERRVSSEPWDHFVHRFTCNKDRKTLYIHVFGDPAGREVNIGSLAKKGLFKGRVQNISLIGGSDSVKWSMQPDGLKIQMPERLAYTTCNILKVNTTGLW